MKRIKEEQTITQKEVKSFKEPDTSIGLTLEKLEKLSRQAKDIECEHQFFKIADETKSKEENMTRVPYRWGVKVMCVLCGQQRMLWTDGEVEVL